MTWEEKYLAGLHVVTALGRNGLIASGCLLLCGFLLLRPALKTRKKSLTSNERYLSIYAGALSIFLSVVLLLQMGAALMTYNYGEVGTAMVGQGKRLFSPGVTWSCQLLLQGDQTGLLIPFH